MRKIHLTNYSFGNQTFEVGPSIGVILFNEPKLDSREVIRRDELANKIESCKEEYILLEEVEWSKIVSSLQSTDLKPLGRSVVEFLKRILDAPQIEVQEKS